MSSPGHSTSNNEDAFSSNISNYVSTIPNYFPASSGKTYSNASNNSTGKIPPEFLPFYNMKDIQAFYAKELPIPSPYHITPPVILTPSPQIHPPSSSSTTLSNSSRKQAYIALGPRYEVGESSFAAAARPAGGFRADYGFVATMDREIMQAKMSREAWVRATDASDLVHGKVMSLGTTVLGQMSEIKELQAADRRRQTVILELL
nr:hypothetical protein [Tanacetum cinerariifolium]